MCAGGCTCVICIPFCVFLGSCVFCLWGIYTVLCTLTCVCTCMCVGFPMPFPKATFSELALCCLFDMAEHLLHVEAPTSLHTSRFLSPVFSGCLSSSKAFVPYFLYPKWIFSTGRINPLWLAPMRCGRASAWKFKPYFAKITRLPSTPIHLHSLTPAFIANLPWFKLLPFVLFCSKGLIESDCGSGNAWLSLQKTSLGLIYSPELKEASIICTNVKWAAVTPS